MVISTFSGNVHYMIYSLKLSTIDPLIMVMNDK